MNRFRIQTRHLYLLALFQLVAGPLVLVLVTMFCTLAVRELPQNGVAKAIVMAWHSDQFQSLLTAATDLRMDESPSALPRDSHKAKLGASKMTLALWESLPALPVIPIKLGTWASHAEAWTPAWPQAPPGPPPRVG